MTDLIILAGIPGCGKSTWAKSLFDLKYHIANPDALRIQEYGSLTAAHEGDKAQKNKHIFSLYHREIGLRLEHGVDVIADATNLNSFARERLCGIAKEYRADTHLVLFKNIADALARNAARDEDSRVPEAAMDHMMEKYWDTLAEVKQEYYKTVTKVERFV